MAASDLSHSQRVRGRKVAAQVVVQETLKKDEGMDRGNF